VTSNFEDSFVYIPDPEDGPLAIFAAIPLVIPSSEETGSWKVKLSLGYDFLSGGSIG
jgi:hypothetical protein